MQLAGTIKHAGRRNDLGEYSLLIIPGPEAHENIKNAHRDVDAFFPSALHPQICIADFMIKEEMEATLFRWIQNICNLHPRFSMSLNNYSSFPPHTIYLRIQDAEPVKKLINSLSMLNSFIIANECPPIQFTVRPHLIIASGLPDHVYEEAVSIFSAKSFYETFSVEKLVLIKKNISGTGETINTFSLPASPLLFE